MLDGMGPKADRPEPVVPAKPAAARDGMNATEKRYADVLDAEKKAGDVLEWWFEPFSLRLAPSTYYRPDFLVMRSTGRVELHEVKGAYVQEDAWIKTKVAAAMYPFPVIVAQWLKKQWNLVEL